MKLILLNVIVLGCWLISATVAAAVAGPGHWLPSGVATLICLLPASLTLVMASWTEQRSLVESLGFLLVAPVFRLMVVIGVGLALGFVVTPLKAEPARFAFWGAGFYLVTLVVETTLLLTGKKPNGAPGRSDSPGSRGG